jgi:hypothetical protein
MSLNSSISDETLLGYLLFALPEEEQWRIETLAASDSVLQQRIQDLRDLLSPIQACSQPVELPRDLTASTMAMIAKSQGSEKELKLSGVTMTQPLFESSRATQLAWIDSLVTLAAGIAILTILLPSVWYSRESARRTSCAANLRQLGHALDLFAQSNPERQLPRIDVRGPLNFAGVYSMRLKDAGLLGASNWIWCPSVENLNVGQDLPSIESFLSSSPETQESLRYSVMGNLSFNLGIMIDEVYTTPSFQGSTHFAVLGDSLPNIADDDLDTVHGANASNILFGDGRIQPVKVKCRNASTLLDDPYLNLDRKQAVGIGSGDTCLGPSFQHPFKPVRSE